MAKVIAAQLEGIHIFWRFIIGTLFLFAMFGFYNAFKNIFELIVGY